MAMTCSNNNPGTHPDLRWRTPADKALQGNDHGYRGWRGAELVAIGLGALWLADDGSFRSLVLAPEGAGLRWQWQRDLQFVMILVGDFACRWR